MLYKAFVEVVSYLHIPDRTRGPSLLGLVLGEEGSHSLVSNPMLENKASKQAKSLLLLIRVLFGEKSNPRPECIGQVML